MTVTQTGPTIVYGGPFSDATLTDTGNALRLVERHGEMVRYVPDRGQGEWLMWDGTRWRPDVLGEVTELAKETAESIYLEVHEGLLYHGWTPDEADVGYRWARQSLNAHKLTAMLKTAQTVPAVALEAKRLDTHDWLLPCTNVTLDLRTFELRPADPADYMTKSTGIGYDKDAHLSPVSEQFLEDITCGDEDLEEYLQKILGYTTTGDTSRRLVFFLHGPEGRNGKSTFLEQVRYILGDFAKLVPMETLEKQARSRGGGAATPDITALRGARFVTASETESDMQLSAARFKNLAGNEYVYERGLYSKAGEYKPNIQMYLATNYRPNIPARDSSVWDRLRIIPFNYRADEKQVDTELPEKLRADAVAWLTWMVAGLYLISTDGLTDPQAVRDASQNYRKDMDTFGDFLLWLPEYVEDIKSSYTAVPFSYELGATHKLYAEQAKLNGWEQLDVKRFSELMVNAGYTKTSNYPKRWKLRLGVTAQPHYKTIGELQALASGYVEDDGT